MSEPSSYGWNNSHLNGSSNHGSSKQVPIEDTAIGGFPCASPQTGILGSPASALQQQPIETPTVEQIQAGFKTTKSLDNPHVSPHMVQQPYGMPHNPIQSSGSYNQNSLMNQYPDLNINNFPQNTNTYMTATDATGPLYHQNEPVYPTNMSQSYNPTQPGRQPVLMVDPHSFDRVPLSVQRQFEAHPCQQLNAKGDMDYNLTPQSFQSGLNTYTTGINTTNLPINEINHSCIKDTATGAMNRFKYNLSNISNLLTSGIDSAANAVVNSPRSLNRNMYSCSNETNQSSEEDPEIERNRIRAERLALLEQKRKEEEDKAQREHEERLKNLAEKRAQKNKLLVENMQKEQKNDEFERMKREEKVKIAEEELEKKKRSYVEKTVIEEMKHQKEMDYLKEQGDIERKEIENERQKEKLKHEIIVKEQDERFVENALKEKQETERRTEEIIRLQAEHEENVRQIHEKLERDREEMYRKHKENMEKMKEQWEQIKLMFQYKCWNEIIEKNWTNRLNVLRSANRKVAELFRIFDKEARGIQRKIEKLEDFTNEKSRILPVLKTLIGSIEPEKEMMAKEIENLEIQFENTGKMFVYQIKESVMQVKWTCDSLEKVLKEYLKLIETEHHNFSTFEHKLLLEQIKQSFDDLTKTSNRIPTLAELKKMHSGEMNRDTSPNTNQEIVPFHTVIIEEVE